PVVPVVPVVGPKFGGGKTHANDGCVPTGMVETSARPTVSMTDTSFEPELATKATVPSGDIAIDDGSVPTLMVATWLFVRRSKTTTVAGVALVVLADVLVEGVVVAFAALAPVEGNGVA